MRRARMPGLVVVGLCWSAWAGGCSDSDEEATRAAKLAEGCSINSDCSAPLVCAFERCHEQCKETRDCPPGQRCVRAGDELGICQLPDESDCTKSADCEGKQLCSPDRKCRDGCTAAADCLATQTCTNQQVCADASEVDSSNNLNTVDAGSGGSGGSGGAGGSGGSGGSGDASVDGSGGSSGATGSGGAGGDGGAAGASDAAGGSAGADSGCPTGYGNCDSDPDCEANLNLPTRCGSCTKVCNTTNTTTVTCPNMQCVVSACNAGFGDCDDDPDTGCEVTFATDARNCGKCGRSCGTATCTNGKCDEVVIGTLPGGSTVRAHAMTAAYVFVDVALGAGFEIHRFARDGSGGGAVASGATETGGMASDGTDVYYVQTNAPNSVVYKMAVAGAPNSGVTAFQTPNHPRHLAIFGNALYWATLTGIRSATKTGAGETPLVSGQVIYGNVLPALAVNGTSIYWITNGSEVRTSPLAGGPGTLVQGNLNGVRLIADSSYAFFANYSGAAGGNVFRHPGGPPWEPWIFPAATGIAVDASNVYVTTFTGGEYVLRVGPKNSNTSTPVQSTTLSELIAVDATHIYGIAGIQVKKLPK